jgi:hypothetical protein
MSPPRTIIVVQPTRPRPRPTVGQRVVLAHLAHRRNKCQRLRLRHKLPIQTRHLARRPNLIRLRRHCIRVHLGRPRHPTCNPSPYLPPVRHSSTITHPSMPHYEPFTHNPAPFLSHIINQASNPSHRSSATYGRSRRWAPMHADTPTDGQICPPRSVAWFLAPRGRRKYLQCPG